LLERETASIIKFVLDAAGNPNPYYYRVPEAFAYPAAYFPPPEMNAGGETFETYAVNFILFVKFFHKTSGEAFALAASALEGIKRAKNLIPLIDENGDATAEGFRVADPSVRVVDDGAAQLQIEWISRRPYNAPDAEKTRVYHIEERIISDSLLSSVERYIARNTVNGG
jgi:hypothetical protein